MDALTSASHVILDAAKMGAAFEQAVKLQPMHACLYQGESARNLASVAPYLFEFVSESDFGRWILSSGCGQSWGLFVRTSAPFEDLRRHLRKFLMIKLENGKNLYFRYYDPRVFRVTIPCFDLDQLRLLFSNIHSFIVESEESGYAIRYILQNSKLHAVHDSLISHS